MNNINEILEKYWAAETTTEEETQLFQYFKNDIINPDHQVFSSLFAQFEDEKSVEAPDMTAFIANLTTEVQTTTDKSKVRTLSIKRYMYAVAAVMTLAIASLFLFKNLPSKAQDAPEVVQVIEDPEEALKVTMQALALLSNKMNHSAEKVKEEMKVLQKVDIFSNN